MSVNQLILDPQTHLLCYQRYMATSNFSFSIACPTRPTLQAASALHSTQKSLINQYVCVYLVGTWKTLHILLLFFSQNFALFQFRMMLGERKAEQMSDCQRDVLDGLRPIHPVWLKIPELCTLACARQCSLYHNDREGGAWLSWLLLVSVHHVPWSHKPHMKAWAD